MQNLNVKKNSIADIKTDLKLCFPGARTAGSAAAQGEKARGSSRGCCRAARPSRWRSWGPPEASDRGPVAGLRVTFGSSLGPRWVPRYLPPSFSSTVDPSLRNAKRRVSQAPRMRAALGGSSLTPAEPLVGTPLASPSLPPPPPGLRGPSEHPAAFRGAEAGAPCPSPQLPQRAPCRGAGHAGCGAPGRWQGSGKAPFPEQGRGPGQRGSGTSGLAAGGRVTEAAGAGQVPSGGAEPAAPRFLLAHRCLLSLLPFLGLFPS